MKISKSNSIISNELFATLSLLYFTKKKSETKQNHSLFMNWYNLIEKMGNEKAEEEYPSLYREDMIM